MRRRTSGLRRGVAIVNKTLRRAEDDRYQMYVRRARNPAKHDDDEAASREFELNLAREGVDSAAIELDAAAAASHQVLDELAALAEQHLDVFSAEAVQSTQEAVAALEALAAPYIEAHTAWRQAQAAWAPLAPALFKALVAAEDSEGVWRDHGTVRDLARVPEIPLPAPKATLGEGCRDVFWADNLSLRTFLIKNAAWSHDWCPSFELARPHTRDDVDLARTGVVAEFLRRAAAASTAWPPQREGRRGNRRGPLRASGRTT